MRFSEDAERFLRPGGDRLVALCSLLASLGLPYSVAKLGQARHVIVRLGSGKPRLALVAHYDRHPDGAGTLDNSCACLQLASFAARQAMARAAVPAAAGGAVAAARGAAATAAGAPAILVAFTDAEEAPGSGGASSQGSYSLARALAGKGAHAGLAALVLDVTGRGGRLLRSTAPERLLARHGREGSPVAAGYRGLVGFADRVARRAGLAEPLGAELPWSDDLGLTLGGMPALALSLLPEAELPLLAAGERPPTWKLLHTAEDSPDKAESASFDAMAAFLDAVPPCLAELAP